MPAELEPIIAKSDTFLTVDSCVTTPTKIFTHAIGNNPDDGWNFFAGNPEFWKYSSFLLVPNGHLLDLGIGHCRFQKKPTPLKY